MYNKWRDVLASALKILAVIGIIVGIATGFYIASNWVEIFMWCFVVILICIVVGIAIK